MRPGNTGHRYDRNVWPIFHIARSWEIQPLDPCSAGRPLGTNSPRRCLQGAVFRGRSVQYPVVGPLKQQQRWQKDKLSLLDSETHYGPPAAVTDVLPLWRARPPSLFGGIRESHDMYLLQPSLVCYCMLSSRRPRTITMCAFTEAQSNVKANDYIANSNSCIVFRLLFRGQDSPIARVRRKRHTSGATTFCLRMICAKDIDVHRP